MSRAIANPRIRIEVDNDNWIEGDTKVNDVGATRSHHWIVLTSDIGPKNLDLLAKVRTALKVTVPGGRQLRFIANGTRDAFIALHGPPRHMDGAYTKLGSLKSVHLHHGTNDR